jgi:hypothetical protein
VGEQRLYIAEEAETSRLLRRYSIASIWEECCSRGYSDADFEEWKRQGIETEGPYKGTLRLDAFELAPDVIRAELPDPSRGSPFPVRPDVEPASCRRCTGYRNLRVVHEGLGWDECATAGHSGASPERHHVPDRLGKSGNSTASAEGVRASGCPNLPAKFFAVRSLPGPSEPLCPSRFGSTIGSRSRHSRRKRRPVADRWRTRKWALLLDPS